jgi:hypothetical protein
MDLQPVSPSEMKGVEGGMNHQWDNLNLVAPYNQGGGGFSSGASPGFGSGGGRDGDTNGHNRSPQ